MIYYILFTIPLLLFKIFVKLEEHDKQKLYIYNSEYMYYYKNIVHISYNFLIFLKKYIYIIKSFYKNQL